MRVFSCLLLVTLLAGSTAAAQDRVFPPPDLDDAPLLGDPFQPVPDTGIEPIDPPAEDADESAQGDVPRLDRLFAELKRERSTERAAGIAARIQSEWRRSGSATVDLLLGWSAQAVLDSNHGAAFDLLEQAMLLDPSYAEAWNVRATLNFQLERYGRSLADIEQTLAREPRHFGALMGLAAILEMLGRDQQALETYERVLNVYPALPSAQDAVGRLADEIGGRTL